MQALRCRPPRCARRDQCRPPSSQALATASCASAGSSQQAQAQAGAEELGAVAAAIFEHVDLETVARRVYSPGGGVAQVGRWLIHVVLACLLSLLHLLLRPPCSAATPCPQSPPELLLVLCRRRAGFERLMADAYIKRQVSTAAAAAAAAAALWRHAGSPGCRCRGLRTPWRPSWQPASARTCRGRRWHAPVPSPAPSSLPCQMLHAFYANLYLASPTAAAHGLEFWTVAHLWRPGTLVRHW